MSTDNQSRAMMEFLGSFSTISGGHPEHVKDLSDGVVLFEALSEMYVLGVFWYMLGA
jgi:hypothetical protein